MLVGCTKHQHQPRGDDSTHPSSKNSERLLHGNGRILLARQPKPVDDVAPAVRFPELRGSVPASHFLADSVMRSSLIVIALGFVAIACAASIPTPRKRQLAGSHHVLLSFVFLCCLIGFELRAASIATYKLVNTCVLKPATCADCCLAAAAAAVITDYAAGGAQAGAGGTALEATGATVQTNKNNEEVKGNESKTGSKAGVKTNNGESKASEEERIKAIAAKNKKWGDELLNNSKENEDKTFHEVSLQTSVV
jgi:hypothetical protein